MIVSPGAARRARITSHTLTRSKTAGLPEVGRDSREESVVIGMVSSSHHDSSAHGSSREAHAFQSSSKLRSRGGGGAGLQKHGRSTEKNGAEGYYPPAGTGNLKAPRKRWLLPAPISMVHFFNLAWMVASDASPAVSGQERPIVTACGSFPSWGGRAASQPLRRATDTSSSTPGTSPREPASAGTMVENSKPRRFDSSRSRFCPNRHQARIVWSSRIRAFQGTPTALLWRTPASQLSPVVRHSVGGLAPFLHHAHQHLLRLHHGPLDYHLLASTPIPSRRRSSAVRLGLLTTSLPRIPRRRRLRVSSNSRGLVGT